MTLQNAHNLIEIVLSGIKLDNPCTLHLDKRNELLMMTTKEQRWLYLISARFYHKLFENSTQGKRGEDKRGIIRHGKEKHVHSTAQHTEQLFYNCTGN